MIRQAIDIVPSATVIDITSVTSDKYHGATNLSDRYHVCRGTDAIHFGLRGFT